MMTGEQTLTEDSQIWVKGLSVTYGEPGSERATEAIRDISLTVGVGEFLVLIGPSGCGKSTLLSTVAGLTRPTTGEVLIDGEVIVGPNPEKVAFMFQEHLLLPWRTVRRNIAFGIEASGLAREQIDERVEKYLRLVDLMPFADAFPHQLSGGMKQRIALCRALAMETQILLMDEPFGALDEQTRMTLADELIEIWSTVNRTILFVTHGLHEAAYLADRIAVFTRRPGEICDIVPVREKRPREPSSEEQQAVYKRLLEGLRVHDADNRRLNRPPKPEE